MSGLEKVAVRIPARWDATWFRWLLTEVLAKADVRNASGNGVTITGDPTTAATLSVSGRAPAGGAAGKVLKKVSATDYDYAWQDDLTGGGGGGNLDDALALDALL